MEFLLIVLPAVVMLGLYGLVTGNYPTMKSLRSVPVLNSIEARSQGHADMRKAMESAIVEQDYLFSRQAIEDEHAKRMKKRYSNQEDDDYAHYLRGTSSSQSKSDALEALEMKYKRAKRRVGTLDIDTVASFVVKWETGSGKVFPFDPSRGQTGEYYFGADAKIYDNYIEGGMDYLNELGQVKSRVVERTSTVNSRKTIQTHLNRQWKANNEAQHMLQIEAMASAQEKFDADMQRIVESSRMIEGK